MEYVKTHLLNTYIKKRHNFKKIRDYYKLDVDLDGTWYKLVKFFIDRLFNDLHGKVHITNREIPYWVSDIYYHIFHLRVIPHLYNFKDNVNYVTYVVVNLENLSRNERIKALRIGLFIHQAMRKNEHIMYVVEEHPLVNDLDFVYDVKKHNSIICKLLNKKPKMPRIFGDVSKQIIFA